METNVNDINPNNPIVPRGEIPISSGNIPTTIIPNPIGKPGTKQITIVLTINDPIPSYGVGEIIESQKLNINPIAIPLKKVLLDGILSRLQGKVESYFDQDRQLKTLLNFGNDYQSLMLNWKYDQSDSTGNGIIVKLYQSLPDIVDINSQTYISRELVYPLLEKIYIVRVPDELPKIYLRPANKRIKVTGQYGSSVNNVTLNTLLSSGAFDPIKPVDSVTDQWFTTALEGAELNNDYSNFKNFIFFGSAQKRLDAFKNKLQLIETFDRVISQNSSSISAINSASLAIGSGSVAYSASSAYPALYSLAQNRQEVIRSFDGYERFLYYDTAVPMSGTFSGETSDFDHLYYLSDITWPKISGSVSPILSASSWYTSASVIASDYDNWNVNRFINNIPEYIKNDNESLEYVKFFDMAGHVFDLIKVYIDQMPNIYDRNNDSTSGLSSDLIWDIAKGFGINLPNQYAVESLLHYTIGKPSGSTSIVYRDAASETWKRFLHNQLFMMKSKGTKAALRALLNSYGILPTTIQIRESSTPSFYYSTSSYEIIEEQSNVLNFAGSQSLQVGWGGPGLLFPTTVEMRFATTDTGVTRSLFNTSDNKLGVRLVPSGSSHRVEVVSGSSPARIFLSSSYLPISTGEFYSIGLRYNLSGSTLFVKKVDDEGDFEVNYTQTEPSASTLEPIWGSATTAFLGGSGSLYGSKFVGYIDEFRIWNESLTDQNFDNWVKYPGLYYGNDPSSSRQDLLVRLSFNIPQNLGSGTVPTYRNESPWMNYGIPAIPAQFTSFSASGFSNESSYPYSMRVLNRVVQRLSPTAGGNVFDSNKIIINDAPVLKYLSGSSVPVLSSDMSIVSPSTLQDTDTKANNTIGFYFSTTEAINDSIIRSIGNINLHDYIGNPAGLTSSSYKELDDLNTLYWTYYAYNYSVNDFIVFVKNLMGPLFEQAESLIPARSKLMSGIVIEPHILERYRVPLKPLLNEDEDVMNLEANPNTTQPTHVTAEDKDLIVTINQNSVLAITPNYTNYLTIMSSSMVQPSVTALDVDKSATIYVNVVFTNATQQYNTLPLSQSDYYTPLYSSLCNLNNIDSVTYFDNASGLVGLKKYITTRIRQNVLTDRGTWIQGTTYNKDDMVVQPTTITDDLLTNGNGKEFYAIGSNFISNVAPWGDSSRWKPVSYTTLQVLDVKRAALFSGSFTLVPTGSLPTGATQVNGYLSQHYRNFAPSYTAFVNARYIGCLQTSGSTFDGKDAWEVIKSAADTLVVKNTSTPVQFSQDVAGPRLDVQ